MKDYLKNLPAIVGTCKICTINIYNFPDKVKPAILPCGIENCPYESKAEQAKIDYRKGKIK